MSAERRANLEKKSECPALSGSKSANAECVGLADYSPVPTALTQRYIRVTVFFLIPTFYFQAAIEEVEEVFKKA